MRVSSSLFGTRFGLYLCPAEPKAQRLGAEIVGYDLQNQAKLPIPEYINPEWIGGRNPGGFYLPLLEGVYTDQSFLPQIKQDIEACIACLSPQAQLAGTKGRLESKNGGRWWNWRVNASEALIVLQTLLFAKLSRYITQSLYEKNNNLARRFSSHHRARLKLFRTPNGLDSWEPSFPIVKAYKGVDAVNFKSALGRALAPLHTITFDQISLIIKPPNEKQWQIYAHLPVTTPPKHISQPIRKTKEVKLLGEKHMASKVPPTPQAAEAAARRRIEQRAPIHTVMVATGNSGKINELQEALSEMPWQIQGLGNIPLPPETGSTYEENAALKACAAAHASGLPAIADDSGLEVEALDGAPGIYSARFGNFETDLERNLYLLERLRGAPTRRAKFVSALVLAYPDGDLEFYRGEVKGTILEGPQGHQGFGYDPLFLPEGENRSMAELSLIEKRSISHRGQAIAQLLAKHQAKKNVV